MLQDLRQGLRLLLQSKGWTLVVLVSLALGIGANTAVFSAVNAMLLRKLPVAAPDDLVRFKWVGQNDMVTNASDYGNSATENGERVRATFSYPMYLEFRKNNRTLLDLFACAPMSSVNVVANGSAEIASAFIASGNYFNVLGINAVVGRTITPEDDRPEAPPVAVISYGYWTRRFGKDSSAIGKVIQANNTAVTVIGVLPPEFTGVQLALPFGELPDITFPIAQDSLLIPPVPGRPGRLGAPTYWWLQVMGRLKQGVTPQQVQGNLDGMFQGMARSGLEGYLASLSSEERNTSRNRERSAVPRLRVSSGSRGVYDIDNGTLRGATILSVVVVLVLLIVCANIANLLLSRAMARQKEISIRLSMGATRLRLVRQLLTENMVLAFLGGALGIVVAYWGKQLLPDQNGQAPLDWRVLSFAVLLTFFTAVGFGMAPALRATKGSIGEALKQNSRSIIGSRVILGKVLLVAQVAISLVLVIGAGLFLQTLRNLRGVDVGFNPENLVVFHLSPQLNRYEDVKITALYRELTERLEAAPGVLAVTLSNPVLLSGNVFGTSFVVQGRGDAPGQSINQLSVADNFFDVMEMPMRIGRRFTRQDAQGAPPVAIINEAAAQKFFPNENPIGRHFGASPEDSNHTEVVGVVRDAKYNSVRAPAPATMYVPYLQSPARDMFFEVRTAGPPENSMGAIREAVRQVDSNVPLMEMSTQLDQIDQQFAEVRFFSQAYALFGGLALLLASIGLYGVMSYNVRRRTNEIGIRMALGAQRADVLKMILMESLLLVGFGLLVGLGAALGAGRLVGSLLFGLAPTDAPTIAWAVLVMVLVSGIAAYLPGRQASQVDPLASLHHE